MNSTLLWIVICLAIAALVLGVGVFALLRFLAPDPNPVQTRLHKVKLERDGRHGVSQIDQAVEELREAKKKVAKSAIGKSEGLLGFLESLPTTPAIKLMLLLSGDLRPLQQFYMTFLVIPLVVGLLVGLVLPPALLLGPLAFGVGFLTLKLKMGKRVKLLLTQFTDAMTLVASSLRAGHSLPQAMLMVPQDMTPPIADEFRQLCSDLNLGMSTREAFERMCDRLPGLLEFRLFAVAVVINRETGGNLAEVLDQLGQTIRERFKFRGHLSALTAQSKMSGAVVGGLPIVMFLGLWLFKPDFVAPLLTTLTGNVMIAIAVVMQAMGWFTISKIVKIRY
jgi:tight adherence protein B